MKRKFFAAALLAALLQQAGAPGAYAADKIFGVYDPYADVYSYIWYPVVASGGVWSSDDKGISVTGASADASSGAATGGSLVLSAVLEESADASASPGFVSTAAFGGVAAGDISADASVTTRTAANNAVTLSSGADVTYAFGGFAEASYDAVASVDYYGVPRVGNDATGNAVDVGSGAAVTHVFGGYATLGAAAGNTVTIAELDAVRGYVYGGLANYVASNTSLDKSQSLNGIIFVDFDASADVTGNAVKVTGGEIAATNFRIYGGYHDGCSETRTEYDKTTGEELTFGRYFTGNANNNSVTLTNVNANRSDAQILGGYATYGAANNNTVTLSGGSAYAVIGGESSSEASGNAVTINGDVSGGSGAYIYGGSAGDAGVANDNSVTIEGGTIKATIVGGGGYAGQAAATATNNVVTMTGGTIITGAGSGVYGGVALTATNNTVILAGSDTADAEIYGGFAGGNIATDVYTGNKLVVKKPSSAAGVYNFETLAFELEAGAAGPWLAADEFEPKEGRSSGKLTIDLSGVKSADAGTVILSWTGSFGGTFSVVRNGKEIASSVSGGKKEEGSLVLEESIGGDDQGGGSGSWSGSGGSCSVAGLGILALLAAAPLALRKKK